MAHRIFPCGSWVFSSCSDPAPGFSCLEAGFPGGSGVKNPPANAGDAGDTGSIPGLGRSPGGGRWQPTPVFLLGESHGQRILAGYSPWGCKELDMAEST